MWIVPFKNSWAFPIVEAAHLAGVGLIGTIVLADLRRLGFKVASQSAEKLDYVFKPWARAGVGVLVATGAAMTAADWVRYRRNPAFAVKMIFATLAIVSYFVPRKRKSAAVASLLLWTAAILAARAIADFDT